MNQTTQNHPAPVEADFIIPNFQFKGGEVLDVVNPPELGILDNAIKWVKRGRYILVPTSDETRGHRTHTFPAIWQQYLARLLAESQI